MSDGPYELVLFDFGGVVLRTPFELLPEEDGWRGPFGPPGSDPLWDQSIAEGGISEREYWRRHAAEVFPEAADPTFLLMRRLYETDEARMVRPEVVALLDRLVAADLRIAVLTNDLRAFHGEEWVRRVTVLRRFEEVVDLSTIGFLKPAREAYDHALKVLDVAPEDVLFVDDQPPNVVGATEVGIDAVRFDPTDVDASIRLVERRVWQG